MGFRFRRSVKLFPGIRINFSKSGISTSIGKRGVSTTFGGKGGTRVNVGIPGTGLSYNTKLSSSSKKRRYTTDADPSNVVLYVVIATFISLLLAFFLSRIVALVFICGCLMLWLTNIYFATRDKKEENTVTDVKNEVDDIEPALEPVHKKLIINTDKMYNTPHAISEDEPFIAPQLLRKCMKDLDFKTDKLEYDENVSYMLYLARKKERNEVQTFIDIKEHMLHAIKAQCKYANEDVVLLTILGDAPKSIIDYSMGYFIVESLNLFFKNRDALLTNVYDHNIEYVEASFDKEVLDCYMYAQGISGLNVVQSIDYGLKLIAKNPKNQVQRCYQAMGVQRIESLMFNLIETIYTKHDFSISGILIQHD